MSFLLASARNWLNAGLGFFYPETCQLCRRGVAAPADSFVCDECQGQVRFITPPFCERCGLPSEGDITTAFECTNCREMKFHFRTARAAVKAKGVVLEAIHRYKYSRAFWFEGFLAGLLIRQAAPVLQREQWDFIVPIPLHPVKRREREFNQAERLAARLSAATGVPLNKRLLRRVVATRTQTLLSRRERQANMRGAFTLRRRGRLDGLRIVLVDDVFTTGATASACARVLRRAGVGEVSVWTVARGI